MKIVLTSRTYRRSYGPHFEKRLVYLMPIDAKDDVFWDQFWSESVQNVQDVFTLIPAAEVRAVREESPPTLPLCATRLLKNL
ncbi:protein HID1-like isoform X1 [Tachypleus tridentatus]|uniref:protein HID1-like isoform X1 n=1 Tax=Tachypleus tridentatus TaxID=6853 RepID=UPI003FD4CB6C